MSLKEENEKRLIDSADGPIEEGRNNSPAHKAGKGAGLILFLIVFFFLIQEYLGSGCLFAAVFGIPCAGCGSSRAAALLFQGEIKAALQMHPLIFLSLAILIFVPAYNIFCYFKQKKGKDLRSLPSDSKLLTRLLLLTSALYLLVYLVRMLLFFPHTEPMLYNSNSFLSKLIAFLKNLFS